MSPGELFAIHLLPKNRCFVKGGTLGFCTNLQFFALISKVLGFPGAAKEEKQGANKNDNFLRCSKIFVIKNVRDAPLWIPPRRTETKQKQKQTKKREKDRHVKTLFS